MYLIILIIRSSVLSQTMNDRKQCINIPTATYSGKEMSPLRYGISAEEFDTGVVKQGHDGLNWIVKTKNNRNVWVRIYVPSDKMVHEIHKVGQTPNNILNDENKETNKTNEDNDVEDKQEEVIDEEQPMIKEIQKPGKTEKEMKKTDKKPTNYNLFLAYRLNKLKEYYSKTDDSKTKKEIFDEVLAEWKKLDKKSQEFDDVMKEATEFKQKQ